MVSDAEKDKAIKIMTQLAQLRLPDSARTLGVWLVQTGKHKEALEYLLQATKGDGKDDVYANTELGHIYRKGLSVPANLGKAREYYKVAAEKGILGVFDWFFVFDRICTGGVLLRQWLVCQ